VSGAPVQLGQVATFVRGITFKPDDVISVGSSGSIACMRTKNVQTELDVSDVWAVRESLVKRADQYLKFGDLLVSSANSWNLVGKCCWVPELPWRATFGGFISVLRSDRDRIEPRYLYHWFSSPRVQSVIRSFGQQTTNISNLNIDRCERLELRLPSLQEQRRIADILDKADALRAKRRAALAQLDTLTQAVFLDMFGDPATNPFKFARVPLRSLVDEQDDINYGVVQPGDGVADGIPLVRVSDLQDGTVNEASLKRIDPAIEKKYRRSRLRGSEILVSCVGSIGLVAVVHASLRGVNIARAVARIPLRDLRDTSYVVEYLKTQHVQRYFVSELRTVSQPTLNIKQLSETEVVFPPEELRLEFARRRQIIRGMSSVAKRSLRAMDIFFASLQHRAFYGEL
jgi:type I restriction enzyme, S subunit